MKDINQLSLALHEKNQGKLKVVSKVPLQNADDLTLAYSPGVAAPCLAIKDDPEKVYTYTAKGNMVAVVTNGTAVLGLGNIGAAAGLPVMEGKAVLFKGFAGVEAFPIALNTENVDEIVRAVELLEPGFGGINLEDIKAPQCFDIENRLKKSMQIPVFHDDQHGTAIVTTAGLINALRLTGRKFEEIKVVINGAGAAGMAIARLLKTVGTKHIILCDTQGAIYKGRPENMNPYKDDIASITNDTKEQGSLADVLRGADVFIGVSKAKSVTQDMIRSMAKDPIVMAMANPVPEILPEEAKAAGACVVATGRSDYPNQVNNLLAFPGIFRGALDVRAFEINEEMKIQAAYAIASLISAEELSADYVIVSPLDKRVARTVAQAVAKAAIESGAARLTSVTPDDVARHIDELLDRV